MSDYIICYCKKCFVTVSVNKKFLPIQLTDVKDWVGYCRHGPEHFVAWNGDNPFNSDVIIVELSDFEQKKVERIKYITEF